MSLSVYLYFQGECREAFDHYKFVFAAEEICRQLYSEGPAKGGEITMPPCANVLGILFWLVYRSVRHSMDVQLSSAIHCGVSRLTNQDVHGLETTDTDWRLKNWPKAVRIALGVKKWLVFRTAFTIILIPSLLMAGYSLYSQRPLLLFWPALGLLGFQSSSTAPTGIGCFGSTIVWATGLAVALTRGDWVHFVGGIIPGITWIGSCAILGTTAQYLVEELHKSDTTFQTLVRQDILIVDTNAEQSGGQQPASQTDNHDPPPASGPSV